MFTFNLTKTEINPQDTKRTLSAETGAFVSFEGIVRNKNEGKDVTGLYYEAFAELCQSEAEKILTELKQFKIINAVGIHRTGELKVGDVAVWVGVTAAHRDQAFLACRYFIDEIKKRLPIWKKEFYKNGDSGWVNCTHGTHQHDATPGLRK
ncbi:MAG: hypothetical protein A2Z88_10460 [Omnitrophica WOR_2 bacterium GWA2_47_8]|nr:MAG: hypothetical protein A2Z88_10460 [Omnitrophica WOR_2 bacterium GWA2_47_8]